MKRRNAVIRVLATIAAAISTPLRAQEPEHTTTDLLVPTATTGSIPFVAYNPHQSITLILVDEAEKDRHGIDVIQVEYQGRTIKLTAKEIMDALEER